MAIKSGSMGSVYLVSALLIPTEADRIKGEKKTLVVEPRFIVAEDGDSARNACVMLVPRDVDPDRCDVLVSLPFGR